MTLFTQATYWKFIVDDHAMNKTDKFKLHILSIIEVWMWKETFICGFKQIKIGFLHDDVIKWKYFPRNWPLVWGIHRSPVNSPHKDQWRGALMFSLICAWINGWVSNRDAGDLRRHRAHYDVIVMCLLQACLILWTWHSIVQTVVQCQVTVSNTKM